MTEFLKIGNVADQLGVCIETVRKYADNGEMEFHKSPAGHRLFTQDAVDNFKNSHVRYRSHSSVRYNQPTVSSFINSKDEAAENQIESLKVQLAEEKERSARLEKIILDLSTIINSDRM